MHPNTSLAGKTPLVTGASSGIRRAIAEKLGAAGADQTNGITLDR
jgi:NAD(P)-dependent dehydrogenase (short-subunit alcohol dehydrogenase family)